MSSLNNIKKKLLIFIIALTIIIGGVFSFSHYVPNVIAGWGACTVVGCGCRGYVGSGWYCDNCGHSFNLHY